MPLECQVCGEPLTHPVPLSCPTCGAAVPSEVQAQSDAASIAIDAEPETRAPSDGAIGGGDELMRVFRAQFEQRRMDLPKAWTERLMLLASAAEPGRRLATLIFVDLRGYTALTQALPPERLAELVHWFHGVCTRRVALHGGFIIQFLGDAAFAAFGAPAAFERDAESALRALLEIRDEVRQRGAIDGHPLAVRAGADMGVVAVKLTDVQGQQRVDLFGSACNLAARLEAHAETWEILASDTLAHAVRGRFRLEARAPFLPKNYDRQVTPFAVEAFLDAAAVRRDDSLRFVGRDAERAALRDFLQGQPQAMLVQGDAGIGKTRLIREVQREWGGTWITLTCEPHQQRLPLALWIDLLRRVITDELRDQSMIQDGGPIGAEAWHAWQRNQHGLQAELLPTLGYLLRIEPHATQLAALGARQLQGQLLAGVAAWLRHLLSRRGTALWLDDLHWCDRLSLQVLHMLLDQTLPGHVILSGRGDEQSGGASADERIDALPVACRIQLSPLDAVDKARLIAQVLDVDLLASPAQRALLEQAEAQPLLLIELGRMLADELERHPLNPTPAIDDRLPSGIQEILQARLDLLDNARRDLLLHASIIGRTFAVELLGAMLPRREELYGELLALQGLRMIEPLNSANTAFRFAPTLLRELTYGNLTEQQRAAMHREMAIALERDFSLRREDFLFDLAQHWIRGGNIAAARRYLRRAAQRALCIGAVEECRQLLTQAARLQDANTDEAHGMPARVLALQQRAIVADMAGRAARMAGDFADAVQHFERMEQLAREVANVGWQHQARYQLASTRLEQGLHEHARQELTQLLEEHELGDELGARVRLSRGVALLRLGHAVEAASDFDAAEQQAGETSTAADACNNLGLLAWMRGDHSAAEEQFGRAIERWRALGQRFGECASTSNLGIAAEQRGAFAEARRLYHDALVAAETIGYLHGLSAAEANLANVELLAHQDDRAARHAARALRFASLIGHRHSESIALENLGLALAERAPDEARGHLRQAIELGLAMHDPQRTQSARLALAWLELIHHDLDACECALDSAQVELTPDLVVWHRQLTAACHALRNWKRNAIEPDAWDPATLETYTNIPDRLREIDIWERITRTIASAHPREDALAVLRSSVASFD